MVNLINIKAFTTDCFEKIDKGESLSRFSCNFIAVYKMLYFFFAVHVFRICDLMHGLTSSLIVYVFYKFIPFT